MRVADWIGQRLKRECPVIFGVTGGCIINCVDGFYKQGLKIIPMHHEQAAVMAADGYARMTGGLGCCYGTSGPGGQNMLTGIASAFYDSIPILAIIGQVPASQVKMTESIKGLRQYGFQESHNYKMAKPVAKSSDIITDKSHAAEKINTGIARALAPRPGATVVEICDDIQRAEIDNAQPDIHKADPALNLMLNLSELSSYRATFRAAMATSKKPLMIIGAGAAQTIDRKKLRAFIETMKMPVITSWGGKDALPEDCKYYIGGFGVAAERTGVFALKHADLILSIGCKMDTHHIGPDPSWMKDKNTIIVDSDGAELKKLKYGSKFHIDLRFIVEQLDAEPAAEQAVDWEVWTTKLREIRRRFPVCCEPGGYLNGWDPYVFIKTLSDAAPGTAIVVGDAGQTLAWTFQAWETKEGQRLFSDFNNSCMGYALPAALGASVAKPDNPVYCIIGDGSFMMNIQELQTLKQQNLNVKVVIIDNGGYGMIMQTQSDWPSLKHGVSCNKTTDLTFPDYEKVSKAFGIPYMDCNTRERIREMAVTKGPMVVRAHIKTGSKIAPKLLWGDTLWNQKPYLKKEEVEWIESMLS